MVEYMVTKYTSLRMNNVLLHKPVGLAAFRVVIQAGKVAVTCRSEGYQITPMTKWFMSYFKDSFKLRKLLCIEKGRAILKWG
jgi:hypothetical protein